jgi:hypothetical protein
MFWSAGGAIEMPRVREKKPDIAAIAAFVLAVVCAEPSVALAQQIIDPGSRITAVGPTTRLAGRIVVPTTSGSGHAFDIEVNRWLAVKVEGGTIVPLQGFYVAHLLAGTVTVDVGGSSEPHREGDFWTVSQGAGMIVQIVSPSEVALLETITVIPRALLR